MNNEFSHQVHPALLHQLYLRVTAVRQESRPQRAFFAPYRSISWQRPDAFVETQQSLGKSRLAIVRYGQPVVHIHQFGVTVVTSAALDLANMLNGVWDSNQPETLRLRQLTRLVDLASWVSCELEELVTGCFSQPTVVQGALHSGQIAACLEKDRPARHILVSVMPFEIARLCAGFLIISLEAELDSYAHSQKIRVQEPYQYNKSIIV